MLKLIIEIPEGQLEKKMMSLRLGELLPEKPNVMFKQGYFCVNQDKIFFNCSIKKNYLPTILRDFKDFVSKIFCSFKSL